MIQVLKENKCHHRLLYPAQLSFRIKEEIFSRILKTERDSWPAWLKTLGAINFHWDLDWILSHHALTPVSMRMFPGKFNRRLSIDLPQK